MSERNYIVVEGVIGAGKSSLSEKLAEALEARRIVENHEENPFLAEFYRDPARYAFQTELFFLLSRYRIQTEQFSQPDLFQKYLISDYLFAKNRIFAHITLEERELALFELVYSMLEKNIKTPDLVIYLQSSTQRLMQNIRIRDREYERNINPAYVESLVEAYNHYFFHYEQSSLLIINATNLDFIKHPDQFQDLFERILNAPEGTSYYNPSEGFA
ncbi:MAG: deoxynucleoside kinase [Candidatus Electryonea clarkiae]|nr:deoxynucleoside kinase [Candidatus Electryonea clarkiae]MDP8286361.1 deoxynucleoside kinase [Candidatus Electryonea clarkiae]